MNFIFKNRRTGKVQNFVINTLKYFPKFVKKKKKNQEKWFANGEEKRCLSHMETHIFVKRKKKLKFQMKSAKEQKKFS